MKKSRRRYTPRFELWSLFGLTTVCALLSGLFPIIGIASAASLMVMAFALAIRSGLLSLFALFAACLTTDLAPKMSVVDPVMFFGLRQMVVASVAAALGTWYKRDKGWLTKYVRRRRDDQHSVDETILPSFVISLKNTVLLRDLVLKK